MSIQLTNEVLCFTLSRNGIIIGISGNYSYFFDTPSTNKLIDQPVNTMFQLISVPMPFKLQNIIFPKKILHSPIAPQQLHSHSICWMKWTFLPANNGCYSSLILEDKTEFINTQKKVNQLQDLINAKQAPAGTRTGGGKGRMSDF